MDTRLTHVIEFVADMDRAVRFYRDVVGLPLNFQSPGWSEFATGQTTLALHPASRESSGQGGVWPGRAEPSAVYDDMSRKGVPFPMPPQKQDFGGVLAHLSILKVRTSGQRS